MRIKNDRIKAMIIDYANEHGLKDGFQPILDGITNPELYRNASKKILFILKEAYSNEDSQIDRDNISDHAKELRDPDVDIYHPPTHERVSKVASCLLRNISLKDYGSEDILPESEAIRDFQSIAWINVGKFPAEFGSRTPPENLEESYSYWKPILYLQIEYFQPDIIIFGGTFHVFQEDLKDEIKKIGSYAISDTKDVVVYRDRNGRVLIDTYHPGYLRMSDEDYVNTIIEAVNNSVNK